MKRREFFKALAALPVAVASMPAALATPVPKPKMVTKVFRDKTGGQELHLTYRVDGPWGKGKGSGLTVQEMDNNFHKLELRFRELEERKV